MAQHAAQAGTKAKGTFLGVPDVPLLGIGLAALGRPGYINLGHDNDLAAGKSVEEMRANCAEVLEAALQAGIRYFDAARSYGRAEEFLASWLDGRGGAPGAVVGSKWGYYYTADWQVDTGGKPHEVKEHTAANLRKQAAETQSYLGGRLNLYQIHSATLESGVLGAADVLQELEQLKRGLGWRIGLSLSGVAQADTLRRAMAVRMSDGKPLFDSVQATWNLLEQSAGGALLEAHDSGMDVIVKEGMANGRLIPRRNTQPSYAPRMAALQACADKYGVRADALALAVAMAQPFRPMVLSGAATVEQLQSNAAALQMVDRLEAHDVEALMTQLVQPPQEYWAERSGMAWN